MLEYQWAGVLGGGEGGASGRPPPHPTEADGRLRLLTGFAVLIAVVGPPRWDSSSPALRHGKKVNCTL